MVCRCSIIASHNFLSGGQEHVPPSALQFCPPLQSLGLLQQVVLAMQIPLHNFLPLGQVHLPPSVLQFCPPAQSFGVLQQDVLAMQFPLHSFLPSGQAQELLEHTLSTEQEILPILFLNCSVNQIFPSEPIARSEMPREEEKESSVISPATVTFPILFTIVSLNQRFLSGPTIISRG